LAGRRGAGEDLGQSILDRCHLPETLVITKRGDNIVQVPIEDLDPVTDLVLSKEGFFREFEVGARLISEPISLLHVAKIDPPIGCTRDHKYPVLRGAEVLDITAGEIKPGDYLQVAQIPISEAIKDVDLAEFMDGQEGSYTAKRSGNEVSLRLAVTNKTDNSFTVTYEKDQTSPRQINRSNNLNAVLEWADTLNEPVSMQSAEICEKFDLHPAEFKDMRRQLAQLGYNVTVTKSKHIVFPKNVKNLRADTSANYTKEFPRYLKLDGDFGYFLGYWLGDGHISKRHDIDYGVLGFTYGPNEILSVASIENKIKPILNLYKATWSETLAGAGIHLSSCQDALIRWIGQNFGHTCEDKHLPYWIFDTSKEFLFGVLRGFVDSDGDVTCNKKGSTTVRLSNTNAVLIDQLFLICTSLGIPASKPKPTKERWVKQANGQVSWAKPSYSIYFTQGPVVRRFFESGFLAKRKEPDSWKDGRSGSLHVFFEDKLYYRVEEVGSAHHDGLVYSLNVHEDHSFYSCNVAARNCLRVLFFRDKLRQAQTQIASRAMTPKRIVWADRISEMDVMDLREQVDLALVDPDYSIVTNYEVHWEEMGARDRLLDLSSEYEITDKQLHAGLGVTESLLSGETLYAGDRLKLEVINTRYMFLREMLQDYVENNLFKPVARRKGFVEKNEWGEEVVLYPRLSFTRLPLRDSQDTYDALFNLYQKGSIDVSLILEMFNIDPEDTKVRLQKDLFTVNDAIFNEVMRGIYSAISQKIVDETDVADRIIKELNLKIVPKAEEPAEGRY
jgi:intein/homing endonuclease